MSVTKPLRRKDSLPSIRTEWWVIKYIFAFYFISEAISFCHQMGKFPFSTLQNMQSHGYLNTCFILWEGSDAVVKNLPVNAGVAGDASLIPGSERSPGGGHGNPLQYSCLKNPMDGGTWWVIVHRVAKNLTWLNDWACTQWLGRQSTRFSRQMPEK